MRLLSRILGQAAEVKCEGVHLAEAEPWRVDSTRDMGRFLRALKVLVPEDSVAYFEDTGERHFAEYLQRTAITPTVQIARGTIWPKPDCYHVPMAAGMADKLAGYLEKNPCGFVCSHLHIYRDGVVLLEWHDALDNPIYISRSIDEQSVSRFASSLGAAYGIGW